MDRRHVQPLDTPPPHRDHARGDQPKLSYVDLGSLLLLVPDGVERLRAHLLNAITDEVWAEAATGFGDPDLVSE